ncbi:tetratricopeptide repeat protein [Bordetella sp. 2513F-2]
MTNLPTFRAALLLLALAATPATAPAQSVGAESSSPNPHANTTKLDPIPPERGWKGLANLLEALKPGVDTRLDPTPSQITDHIEARLNRGDAEGALAMIEQRLAERQGQPGTDVQLMFQHARALAALGRTEEAIALYTEMTTRFPELPEPWNNLAALHAARGELDLAHEALRMALQANPDYADARANLGDLQLLMALRTYRQASDHGVPGTGAKAEEIENLLKEKSPR